MCINATSSTCTSACRCLLWASTRRRRRSGWRLCAPPPRYLTLEVWAERAGAADTSAQALRAKLELAEFETLWSAGQRVREEDIVNEVSGRLREFSAMGQSPN